METHGQGAALVLCLGIAPPPESDGMAAPPPPPPPAQGLWHRVVSECLRREPVQHGQQLCQAGAGVRELLLALGEKALGETALGESRSEAVVAATLGGDGHEGWDLAVLSIVDGLGVLQQGVLDDLQLAIRALPAPTAASPSRRRRVLPGRVTVWAQLLSCKALRRESRVDPVHTCGLRAVAEQINAFATDTSMDIDMRTLPHTALSEPFVALHLELQEALDLACGWGAGESDDDDWIRLLFPKQRHHVVLTQVRGLEPICQPAWHDMTSLADAAHSHVRACSCGRQDGRLDAVVYWFSLHLEDGAAAVASVSAAILTEIYLPM
jgi:hypothetical protein